MTARSNQIIQEREQKGEVEKREKSGKRGQREQQDKRRIVNKRAAVGHNTT